MSDYNELEEQELPQELIDKIEILCSQMAASKKKEQQEVNKLPFWLLGE